MLTIANLFVYSVLMAASRREQILSTAADLFAARGFHGVSVADLGAACGISGPALYRHFPSKDAMLAEMLVAISEELLAVGRERVWEAEDPREALHALVNWHIDFALNNKALIIVQDRAWASLPSEARETVREPGVRRVGRGRRRLRPLLEGHVESARRDHRRDRGAA